MMARQTSIEMQMFFFVIVLNRGYAALSAVARTYEFHNTFLTYTQAYKACNDRGGILATIHYLGTIPELEFDKKPVSSTVFWIGLSEQGRDNWEWTDGSTPTWTNWGPAVGNLGSCGAASLIYQYYWRKEDCLAQLPYVCEFQTGTCNYTRHPKSSIAGHNNKMEFNKAAEECMDICDEITAFSCRSFEYNTEFRYCQLSSGNRWTLVGYLRTNDPSHDYYHRRCNTGVFVPVESSSVVPSSTMIQSPSASSSSPVISSSPIVTSLEETTSFYVTPTPVWDISSSKLIICTEYTEDLYTSVISPSTSIEYVSATTLAPVQQAIVQLEKTFKVAKENARRKTKVSIADPRPSAQTVGYAAGAIMFGILGAIILIDLVSLFKDLEIMKRNLRARNSRKPTKVILTFDKKAYNQNLKGEKESDKCAENPEALESMDKSSEPEPDYDRPPSEVFDRPRIPRPKMFGRPTLSDQAFSFTLRQATENLYEVPNSVTPKTACNTDTLPKNNQETSS